MHASPSSPVEPVFSVAEGEYLLENTASTRAGLTAIRATAFAGSRRKQFVGDDGRRLVTARPMAVSREWVERNIDDLRARAASGLIALKTRDGRAVDLETLVAARVLPLPLEPHFAPDLLARDLPSGIPMPRFPHGVTQQELARRHAAAAEARENAARELEKAAALEASLEEPPNGAGDVSFVPVEEHGEEAEAAPAPVVAEPARPTPPLEPLRSGVTLDALLGAKTDASPEPTAADTRASRRANRRHGGR